MAKVDWNSSHIIVTCAGGLERFLLQEIQTITGDDYTVIRGAVQGPASLENIYKICLWSHIGSRVLLPLATFPYKNEQDLYDRLRQIQWQDHFTVTDSIAISTSKDASVALNTQFLTYRSKDAIMDYFRDFNNERPNVNTRDPDIRIHVHFDREDVMVSLDLSGDPLHRRGYRVAQNEAPMKETLAAAVLMSAGWPDAARRHLIDPMCGSGTLLIEGAMMQAEMAPGLLRRRFGFECWQLHKDAVWQSLVSDAAQRDQSEKIEFSIKGYDSDIQSIQAALQNIKAAGLEGCIHVERRELANFKLHQKTTEEGGVLVCNPPYGERLDKDTQLIYLYRALGRILQQHCMGWQVSIITNLIEYGDALQLDEPKTDKVYNGPIRCFMRSGSVIERPPQFSPYPFQMLDSGVEIAAPDLINRIRKNTKPLIKWADQQGVYCYRIYDADIPEYNLAIDWYNGHLHVQEYAPPKTVEPEKAARRLQDALDSLKASVKVFGNGIHVKSRQRQKGNQQYQKMDDKKRTYLMEEQGALILVNFDDYLDTGLFLDHRPTRLRLQTLAHGKRFLNLYCYTGAATVHAAIGGAKKTVSVDMSATYLNWARNNLYINGLSEANHQLVRADCMVWLQKTNEQFDVIFVDPPTFSNSKKMQGHFDVQQSHEELIDLTMKRLEPGGVLIFSNNFNRFALSEHLSERYDVKDVTKQSLPQDFQKGKPAHHCWEFQYKA